MQQQLVEMLLGGFEIEEHSLLRQLVSFGGVQRRYGDLDSRMLKSDWLNQGERWCGIGDLIT